MSKLMAYADGELEGRERLDAEKLLATDPDALRFVEQMTGVAKLVGEGYAARPVASAIASFDVADAVMAKLEGVTRDPPVEEGRVSRAATVAKAGVTSLDVARARRQQRLKIGGGVVAALALAASVFFLARPSETPMAQGPSTIPTTAPNTQQQAASNGTNTTGNGPGVDVSAVESPGHSVSVFYLPSANELSTSVVVWVDETGDKQ
jgi:anti-sigma factor RsiW